MNHTVESEERENPLRSASCRLRAEPRTAARRRSRGQNIDSVGGSAIGSNFTAAGLTHHNFAPLADSRRQNFNAWPSRFFVKIQTDRRHHLA